MNQSIPIVRPDTSLSSHTDVTALLVHLYGDIMGYRGREGEGDKHRLGGYNDQPVDGLTLFRGEDVKQSIGGDNDYTVLLLLHQDQESQHAQVVTTTRLAGISLKKG